MGFRKISCSLVMLFAVAGSVSASDENLNSLDRAKSLYASAAYDEALVVLDHLSSTPAIDDPMSVAAYRVYCLLALDREDEARTLIDRLLRQSPLFVPSANEASPHIQTIFRDVRHAALPKIARERYVDAKAAFDRKDQLAVRRFDELLALLDDPDLRDWAAAADLRAVASAFRDLAQAVATAPVAPVPEPRRAEPPSPAPLAAPDVTYTAADADVIPPVAVQQQAPQWRPSIHESGKDYTGVLRLLIDRSGTVTSATMQSGTLPAYDQALIRAARDWKFQPALKQGRPVRYLKIIEIRLAPTNP
jgi:TonB family protein